MPAFVQMSFWNCGTNKCAGNAGAFTANSHVTCTCQLLFVFPDLVADHTADSRSANGADSTAAREHCTTHCTDTGADGSAFVTIRHPGTTAQTKQRGNNQGTDCKFFRGFHC
jgi:hypothetical protein